MTFEKIKNIFEKNQKNKDNTYLAPTVSFSGFIRDELTYVRHADATSCSVWRAMDGKLYNLSITQIEKFKCVGSC